MKIAILCAMLLSISLSSLAQSEAPFHETMEVRIINVDVVVVDRDGEPITGLTAADFEIHENGEPQAITNFAEYREQIPGQGPTILLSREPSTVDPREPDTRHLLFFFDRLQLIETANRTAFFRGLRTFVEQSMREGDTAAVYVHETSLTRRVAMTTDRSLVLAAIDRIESECRLRTDLEAMQLKELEIRKLMYGRERDVNPDPTEQEIRDARVASQQVFDEQRRKTRAINAVLQSVSGLDGRKVLVLLTQRLSKHPGMEFGYRATEFNARAMLDSIVDNANAAGVTVFGFYPQGIDTDLPSSADSGSEGIPVQLNPVEAKQLSRQPDQLVVNQAEALDSIATRTGGIFAVGGQLAAEALHRVSRHLGTYYSLAYRAPDTRKDRERRIRVVVEREGATVLARSAIIDKSDEEIARDRLVAATLLGAGESAIPIVVRQQPARRAGWTTRIVPLEVDVPVSRLTMLPDDAGYTGRFRLMAAATNANGDVSDVAEKLQSFHVRASDLDHAKAGHFTYEVEIKVRETSNRAVVAIRDELSGDTGYAEIEIANDASPNRHSDQPTWATSPVRKDRGPGLPH